MSVFVRKPKAITMIPKTAATRTIAKLATIVIHTLLEVTWSAGDMPMPDCLRASCCLWGPKLDKAETAMFRPLVNRKVRNFVCAWYRGY